MAVTPRPSKWTRRPERRAGGGREVLLTTVKRTKSFPTACIRLRGSERGLGGRSLAGLDHDGNDQPLAVNDFPGDVGEVLVIFRLVGERPAIRWFDLQRYALLRFVLGRHLHV